MNFKKFIKMKFNNNNNHIKININYKYKKFILKKFKKSFFI